MLVFDEFGVRGARLLPPVPKPGIMAKGTPFCHGTIMMRAEAYKALGGYRSVRRTRRMEDIDLWLRFLKRVSEGTTFRKRCIKSERTVMRLKGDRLRIPLIMRCSFFRHADG